MPTKCYLMIKSVKCTIKQDQHNNLLMAMAQVDLAKKIFLTNLEVSRAVMERALVVSKIS